MKNKGIIFSLSMLLLILSFILLNQSATLTNLDQQKTSKTLKSFQSLSDFFSNMTRSLIDLELKGSFKQTQERLLPFNFDVDGNELLLEFNVPIGENALSDYFDSINGFKIFVEDKNYSNFYTGIDANIITVQNALWDGNATTLNFVTEPSCMKISAQETGIVFTRGWCGSFDLGDITLFDINVAINAVGEDLNTISCSWEGSSSCPSEVYNPADTRPHFTLNVLDGNCSLCSFTTTQVKGHFTPSSNNWIAIHCIGGTCSSVKIDLNVAQSFTIDRNSNARRAPVDINVLLKNRIEKFYFDDLNLTISIEDFNLTMETPR